MIDTNPYTRPLATDEDFKMTQYVMVFIANMAGMHRVCPFKQCNRSRECCPPKMKDCEWFHSPISYEGRMIRIGMPFCIASAWDDVRDEFMAFWHQHMDEYHPGWRDQ